MKTPHTGVRVLYLLSDENVEHQQRRNQAKENIQSVKVTNVLGELIFTQNYSSAKNEIEISVADLPAGIYFISVKTKEVWSTGKFVKE